MASWHFPRFKAGQHTFFHQVHQCGLQIKFGMAIQRGGSRMSQRHSCLHVLQPFGVRMRLVR